MRFKAAFVAGLVIGYIAGTRAGRERYEQMMRLGRQVAEHPKVQEAAGTVQAKASDMAKTAAAKAPDLAKTATAQAKSAASSVPNLVSTAKEQAGSRLPFGGKSASTGSPFDRAGDVPVPHQTGDPASYDGLGTTAD